MKVHQCNDEQNVTSRLIDDSVGEPVGSAAASSLGEGRPGFGVLKDSFESSFYFLGELRTEAGLLRIVIVDDLS